MEDQNAIYECISGRLGKIKRKIDSIYRIHLSPLNMTESQTMILLLITDKGSIRQTDLANSLGLEKSSLSRLLTRLIGQGYIQKSESYHPTLSLTQKGVQFIPSLRKAWQNAMDDGKMFIGDDGWNALAVLSNKK